jgi:hypothetical protein
MTLKLKNLKEKFGSAAGAESAGFAAAARLAAAFILGLAGACLYLLKK